MKQYQVAIPGTKKYTYTFFYIIIPDDKKELMHFQYDEDNGEAEAIYLEGNLNGIRLEFEDKVDIKLFGE